MADWKWEVRERKEELKKCPDFWLEYYLRENTEEGACLGRMKAAE